jgi:hypothetical protein
LGNWVVTIDLMRPFDIEVCKDSRSTQVRIPFSDESSAYQAVGNIGIKVEQEHPVVPGSVER